MKNKKEMKKSICFVGLILIGVLSISIISALSWSDIRNWADSIFRKGDVKLSPYVEPPILAVPNGRYEANGQLYVVVPDSDFASIHWVCISGCDSAGAEGGTGGGGTGGGTSGGGSGDRTELCTGKEPIGEGVLISSRTVRYSIVNGDKRYHSDNYFIYRDDLFDRTTDRSGVLSFYLLKSPYGDYTGRYWFDPCTWTCNKQQNYFKNPNFENSVDASACIHLNQCGYLPTDLLYNFLYDKAVVLGPARGVEVSSSQPWEYLQTDSDTTPCKYKCKEGYEKSQGFNACVKSKNCAPKPLIENADFGSVIGASSEGQLWTHKESGDLGACEWKCKEGYVKVEGKDECVKSCPSFGAKTLQTSGKICRYVEDAGCNLGSKLCTISTKCFEVLTFEKAKQKIRDFAYNLFVSLDSLKDTAPEKIIAFVNNLEESKIKKELFIENEIQSLSDVQLKELEYELNKVNTWLDLHLSESTVLKISQINYEPFMYDYNDGAKEEQKKAVFLSISIDF